MKKKLLNISIITGIIFLIIIFLVILITINRNHTYEQGLECFKDKKWSCVIKNFENLNYKDSEDKLRMAKYEYYLQTANYNLEQKAYQMALLQYKKALLLNPYNDDIKIKIKSLEILAEEQQKIDEIKHKQQEEENRRNEIKSKISNTAIYPIPTKLGNGYDQTIKRYGVTTINKINKLAPKAAELVAQNPSCTRVIAVDVADDKSTRNSITFFVDCGDIDNIRDIQRFYVNEKEIKANTIPKSIREQSDSIDNSKYLIMCEAEIKARLNFPSTFKSNAMYCNVNKAAMNTVITIPFKVKNAFNLELKHKGICYYNGKTLTDIEIYEEQ